MHIAQPKLHSLNVLLQILNMAAQKARVNFDNHIATNFFSRTLDQAAAWTQDALCQHGREACEILGQPAVPSCH